MDGMGRLGDTRNIMDSHGKKRYMILIYIIYHTKSTIHGSVHIPKRPMGSVIRKVEIYDDMMR